MFRRKWELAFVSEHFESSYGKFWFESSALDRMRYLHAMIPGASKYITVRRVR